MSLDSTQYPYSTIVRITDTIGGTSYQASGVLITPDEVLTAAHVVWTSGIGAASNIKVVPAYNQGGEPYGSATGTSIHYFQIQDGNGSITFADSQSDFAVIHLSRALTAGTMGLESDFSSGYVNVTGFPASANGSMVTSTQFVNRNPFYTLLEGTGIGEGSSGGPVWVNDTGGPHVVGVISTAIASVGYFAQITTSILNQIQAWVAQDDGFIPGTYAAPAKNYTLVLAPGASTLTVQDKVGLGGTSTVTAGTQLHFSDQTIDTTWFTATASLSASQIVGLTELYIASFNRAPDALGFDYWGNQLSGGISLGAIAASFFVQPEAAAAYPSGQTTQTFVNQVYGNVLGRQADTAGLNYWVDLLQNGSVGKDTFLLAIINGALGIDAQYLANKETVGAHFALTQGLSDVNWAKSVMSGVNSTAASVTAANHLTDGFANIAATAGGTEFVVKILGIAA